MTDENGARQTSVNPRFRKGRALLFRLAITAAALVAWFWTQSMIGKRSLPASGIGDGLLVWTTPVNSYLYEHHGAANALLIASSGIIDLLGVFLLAKWIFGPSVRPFLGLVLVLGLRQLMQALVALPAPENTIWHYPGFPSLLVTYGVANDYFFSGHTAIAVLGATELGRIGKRWVTGIAILIVVFEVATVLVLRAHYTMDVFTGAIAALYVAYLAGRISPSIDRLIGNATT
jgi:hypothetical protein